MDYIKPAWGRGFYPIVSLTLFLTSFGVAQTRQQRQEISKTYNIEKLQGLVASFEQDHSKKVIDLKNSHLAKQWNRGVKQLDGTVVALNDIGVDGTPLFYTTHMDPTSKVSRADALYSDGLLDLGVSGKGMTVGIWDAGVARDTHQEFDVRVRNADGGEVDNHGTLVTGTVVSAGIKKQAKGVAFRANAESYDWSRDKIEVTEAAAEGLLVSNHSYGIKTDRVPDWYFGAYIKVSQDWDNIMYNAPYYLMVTAAGNAQNSHDNESPNFGRTQDGFDLLVGFTTAKNGLVVAGASANIDRHGNLKDATVAGYSSFGPIDDGRIKPDLAGDGTLIHSTSSNSNSSYSSSMGTSMAAPGVTGSLILLQEYHYDLYGSFMKASTLKGLALHTSDDIKEAGPDYKMGWGIINTKRAAETLRNKDFSSMVVEETLAPYETYSITVKANGNEPLSASISWTDPAGESVNRGTLNDTQAALTNDLDIRITKGGETHFPWKLNPVQASSKAIKGDNIVDPFERIDLENAEGEYTIRVSSKGLHNNGSQAFSLILTGAELTNCRLKAPGKLSIPSSTDESATISWEAGTSDTLYEVHYKMASEDNWRASTTWDNTTKLSNLIQGEQYEVRLRTVCSQNLASEFSEGLAFVFNGEDTTVLENEPFIYDDELLIQIYPNPAMDFLEVNADLSKDAHFSVFTTSGTTIKSGKVEGAINVADLSSGLYVLTVQDYSGIKSTKFFKN